MTTTRDPAGRPLGRRGASRAGFTLVELLVAMTVGVIVAAVVAMSLSGGFAAWTRLCAAEAPDLDALEACAAVRRDVASAAPVGETKFEGSADRMEFTALVKTNYAAPSAPMMIAWSYDDKARCLTRETWPVQGDTTNAPQPMEVFPRLDDVSFAYLGSYPAVSNAEESAEPSAEWSSFGTNEFPRVVRLTIGANTMSFPVMARIRVEMRPEEDGEPEMGASTNEVEEAPPP